MSKNSFADILGNILGASRKNKIYGEEFFSPRQKELFPGLKRDLIMEIEDAAKSDDPLEACMERKGYKPSKNQLFQEAIAAKMTADMFGKQEKLTAAEAMFQEQMQDCLDRMKTKPKLKFGGTKGKPKLKLGGAEGKPKLVGYTWLTYIGDMFSRHDGGLVAGRISDWSKAETSKGSGRQIVHVYHIQEPDGTINPYGKTTALKRLGYDSPRQLDRKASAFMAEALNKKYVIDAELDSMKRRSIASNPAEANRNYLKEQNRPGKEGFTSLIRTVVYKRDNEYMTTTMYPERLEALAQMGFKPYIDNTTHEKFDKAEVKELVCNSIKEGCVDKLTQLTLFGKCKSKLKFGSSEREAIEKRAQANLQKRIQSGHKAAETRYVELMKRSDADIYRAVDANGSSWIGRQSDVFDKRGFVKPRWKNLLQTGELKLDVSKLSDSVYVMPLEPYEIAEQKGITQGSLVRYEGATWEVGFVNKKDYGGTVRLQRNTPSGQESIQRVPISHLTPVKKMIPEKEGQLTLFGGLIDDVKNMKNINELIHELDAKDENTKLIDILNSLYERRAAVTKDQPYRRGVSHQWAQGMSEYLTEKIMQIPPDFQDMTIREIWEIAKGKPAKQLTLFGALDKQSFDMHILLARNYFDSKRDDIFDDGIKIINNLLEKSKLSKVQKNIAYNTLYSEYLMLESQWKAEPKNADRIIKLRNAIIDIYENSDMKSQLRKPEFKKTDTALFGKGGVVSKAYTSEKKPYEMTEKEWESEKEKAHPENVQTNLTKRSTSEAVRKMKRSEFLNYNTPGEWNDISEQFEAGHKDVILKALAENQRIPEAVLNEYPDLKRMSKDEIDQIYLNQIKDKFILNYSVGSKKLVGREKEIQKILDLVLPLNYTQRFKLSKFIVESAGGQPLAIDNTPELQASLVRMIKYTGLVNAMRDYFGKQVDFTIRKQTRLPKQSVMKFIPEQLHLFGAAPTGTEIYMQDSPISKELQHRFEQTTFYPYDMNKEFNDSVSAKESETIESLRKYGITQIPEDIKTALAYHRKALYEWLVNKANQVPGPMITGPSNYNYRKLDKSIAREDKSYDSLEASREYITKAINRSIKGRKSVIQQTSHDKWKAEALITPKREFANRVFQSAYDKAPPNLKADYDNGVFVTAVKNKGRKFHKELIEEAVKEGLEISPSVKKDYPEMFNLEKQPSKSKNKPEFDVGKELTERQRINKEIVEEWSRPARERIESAAERIEERKIATDREWKAKHSATQLTMPKISPEQFRLFGKSLELTN